MSAKSIPAPERFARKYSVDERGCWIWTAGFFNDGYGCFAIGAGKNVRASRWAYEHFREEIPDGLWVLHRCDTPACVNPEHLFLGTPCDNQWDCVLKGRHPRGKLTPELHEEIREKYTGAWGQQTALAREYGITQPMVHYIVNGGWRDGRAAA
jgi:HNH endonuclease